MFGYLDIDKATLDKGQQGLWQSFMCGLCFSTKKLYGNYPRLFISNDVNFFDVLFHSVLDLDVQLDKKHCFSHPIRKQIVQRPNELSDKLATANVLLTYWNVYDDVVDGGKNAAKNAALNTLKKAYKKAKNNFAELDEMLANRYQQLREMEQSNCDSIDKVAHAFAQLSEDFSVLVLGGATEHLKTLCYNLGKWIYLIDALDDAAKDIKRKQYNPFVAHYGASKFDELKSQHGELQFEMFAVLNRIASAYNDLNLTKYTCLLDNVIYNSVRNKTNAILTKYSS